jgi:hypothetical protein
VTYNCIVQRTEERQNKEKKSEGRKRTKLNQTRENHRAKYEERLKENVFEKSHP